MALAAPHTPKTAAAWYKPVAGAAGAQMIRVVLFLIALTTFAPAYAATGPGLGNLSYSAEQLFSPIGYIESPHGHGNVALVQGYLMVIYSSDGGGGPDDGGIEFWDVSNPLAPALVQRYEDANTHGLREAHGFSLSWVGERLVLAAQAGLGVQLWDVTDPLSIELLSALDIPGIDWGDYSGAWWSFWQAPILYVAGVDSGLFIVDASDPSSPFVVSNLTTGELAGVSPAQVFVLGNLMVLMESQGNAFATVDVSDPTFPVVLSRTSGQLGYSHIFAGPGKIYSSGSVLPQAHVYDVTPEGVITHEETIGLYLDSGGYGSYQDGHFHSGFSDQYVKFDVVAMEEVGTGSSGREHRDEDFGVVLGNIAFAGDDHGSGTALIPHQTSPDNTGPSVEWMHPPAASDGVATTTRIGLSFSDQMDSASLTEDNLWLEDSGGTKVPVRLSVQMGLVNIFPESLLAVNSSYTVVVDGVRDFAGNESPHFEATITTGNGATGASPIAAVINLDDGNSLTGGYGIASFSAGKDVYTDRDFVFTEDYPERLTGQPYVVTANNDKALVGDSFLSFEVKVDSEILVLYDIEANNPPGWLGGFTETGERVVSTDTTFVVFSRSVGPGTVTLGGNASILSGAGSMYSVVIIPEVPWCELVLEPAPVGSVSLSVIGPAQAQYDWLVGEQTLPDAGPSVDVSLPAGRHSVLVRAVDGEFRATCVGVQIVHEPIAATRARVARKLVWHDGDTFNVNPDNGTVTRVDPALGSVVWEVEVGRDPSSLAVDANDTLWVTLEGEARVVLLDAASGAHQDIIELPRASRPRSIVVGDDFAYVALYATGEVARIDLGSSKVKRADAIPYAHGLTLYDGALYVTRFISGAGTGEIAVLNAATLDAETTIALELDPGPDTEASGRGLPNYVAELNIAPDGKTAFVASKKDNVERGVVRDGLELTFESRVRAIVSMVDIETGSEVLAGRRDINDREGVYATAISPVGDLLFVLSQGGNAIEVFETASGRRLSQAHTGAAPQGIALDPAGETLAVYNFLSRSISFFDVAGLVAGTTNEVVPESEVTTVANEVLDARVLAGKRIFYGASDKRMSRDGYIACSSCHFDGDHDGRTWDFTQAGEGLRNTIALNGRAGLGHGNLHWTANFDEVQDFENDIRYAFGGTGFIPDEEFFSVDDPLGSPKGGKAEDLDNLATYVSSLAVFASSPYRREDGAMTAAARRGREVFLASGCADCHGGSAFADGQRHDVGTITAASGLGIGAPLEGVGFDTPTLRGLWETAPYFHDGSAHTLDDVIERHGEVPQLGSEARDDLVAYLLELDGEALEPEADCNLGDECVISESGCGCGAGGAGSLGWLTMLVAMGLWRLRRRRDRHALPFVR